MVYEKPDSIGLMCKSKTRRDSWGACIAVMALLTIVHGIVMLTSFNRAEATIEMLYRSCNPLNACLSLPDVEGLTTNCAIGLCGQ
jgi:hypothetical protein